MSSEVLSSSCLLYSPSGLGLEEGPSGRGWCRPQFSRAEGEAGCGLQGNPKIAQQGRMAGSLGFPANRGKRG